MKLNRWQRGALIAVAALIAVVQLAQFADRGIRGAGWVLSFTVAAALMFVALSGLDRAAPEPGQPASSLQRASSAPSAPAPAIQGAPKRPRPFETTNVDRFITVTRALARELLAWMMEHESGPSAWFKGYQSGMRVTSQHKETGVKADMDAMMLAFIQENCLTFAFGISSFVALMHHHTWEKGVGCREACSRFAAELYEVMHRQELPGASLTDERRREIAKDTVAEAVKLAGLCSFTFWKPWYDGLYGAMSGKLKKHDRSRPGTEELHLWLECPGRRPDNPLAFLQRKLAESTGANFKGSEWQAKLEEGLGPITRTLIGQAIELLDAPLVNRADGGSPRAHRSSMPPPLPEHVRSGLKS